MWDVEIVEISDDSNAYGNENGLSLANNGSMDSP